MDKVIVIGDLHGMYEEFLALAEALQLCDSTGNWIAQNTLLVLTGDVCDRGYNSKDIYRTLMVWQDAAHSFSSKIVFIIGNHEVLNMIGRSTYTTPQEAAAYDTMTQAFFPGGWVREWLEKQHSCFQFGQIVFGHGDLPVVLAELSVKEINMRTMNAISRLGEQQKLSNAGKTDSSIIQNHPELFS